MSELSNSKCHFSSLVISDFILLCSFILSHPLYFSYFLFFSPYLLKLISFLSPLFITTFLLSLAFLTGFVHTESSQTLFASILQRLQFNNEELHIPDDLQIYEIVFGPSSMTENNPCPSAFSEEDKVLRKAENSCAVMEEKRLENFFKILDEFERLASNVEEMKQKLEPPSRVAKSDKVVEKQKLLLINGSEAAAIFNNNNNNNNTHTKTEAELELELEVEERSISSMAKSESERIMSSSDLDGRNLSCYGSMRKEREWKRTLACKLFEERNDVGGGEGMDSLWEAYETEDFVISRQVSRRRSDKMKMKMKMKREKAVEEEDDDEIDGAQLCCLQALKLSAGKMILGVGKPNLVKISKAFKGIGWLHKSSKNSKKVHNHGDHRY